MNETQQTEPGTAPVGQMTTEQAASSVWAQKAALYENEVDLHTQVTDPIFDEQSTPGTITKVESSTVDGASGEAVRLALVTDKELKTIEGIVKAPGFTVRVRPFDVVPAKTEKPDESKKMRERCERGRRDLVKLLVAVKILPKDALYRDVSPRELFTGIASLEGKKTVARFTVTNGRTPREDGTFPKFQNIAFASPDEPGALNGGASGGSGAQVNY